MKKINTNTLQNNINYISCKLDESIPKGIIIYYPMVSILNRTAFVKKIFANSPFFFFLKKINYLNTCFFYCLSSLVVLFRDLEKVERHFSRQLPRQARQQLLSLARHYSQNKLSQPKSQNSENYFANIIGKASSRFVGGILPIMALMHFCKISTNMNLNLKLFGGVA